MKRLRLVKSIAVFSRANGNMAVRVEYRKGVPRFLTRQAIAGDIEQVLKQYIVKKAKPARKAT